MKKLIILTLLMLSLGIVLTGCTSKSDTTDDVNDLVVEDTAGVVKDRDEYQFTMKTEGSDGSDSEMKMYKKDGNSLVEFIKIGVADMMDMPFIMKKILSVGDKTYELIEKDGEEYRFVVPGINATDEMFNLKEMSIVDKSMVVDTKSERINGDKMTCYYLEDSEEGEGKGCIDDGIYRYGEYTQDGVKQTIMIEDYDDDVSDKVFETPSDDDVHSAQDMMKLMQ